MKTPKSTIQNFLVFCVLTVLCMNNAIAQTEKETIVSTEDFTMYSACAGEFITGTEILEMKLWNHTDKRTSFQGKYSFVAVGDISGAIYEGHGIQILNRVEMPLSGYNRTLTWKTLVKRDGIPMSVFHFNAHITVAPDGDIKVSFTHSDSKCFLSQ